MKSKLILFLFSVSMLLVPSVSHAAATFQDWLAARAAYFVVSDEYDEVSDRVTFPATMSITNYYDAKYRYDNLPNCAKATDEGQSVAQLLNSVHNLIFNQAYAHLAAAEAHRSSAYEGLNDASGFAGDQQYDLAIQILNGNPSGGATATMRKGIDELENAESDYWVAIYAIDAMQDPLDYLEGLICD